MPCGSYRKVIAQQSRPPVFHSNEGRKRRMTNFSLLAHHAVRSDPNRRNSNYEGSDSTTSHRKSWQHDITPLVLYAKSVENA